MNNKSAELFLLFVALAPAPALAAKWISLGNKDKARVEIDASSVVRADGGKLRVGHRETHTVPELRIPGLFRPAALSESTPALDAVLCIPFGHFRRYDGNLILHRAGAIARSNGRTTHSSAR